MMSSSSIMQQPFSGSSGSIGEVPNGQNGQSNKPANGQTSGGSQAHPPSAGPSSTATTGDVKPNIPAGAVPSNGSTCGDQPGNKGRKRSASPMERGGPPGPSAANGTTDILRNGGPVGGSSEQPRPIPGGGVPAGGYDGRPNKVARTDTMGPGFGPGLGFPPNGSVPFNLSAPPRMMQNGPGGPPYPMGHNGPGVGPRNGPPLYTMGAPGPDGRGRGTDLFAPQELRARLAGFSKDTGVSFSPESLVYLSLGAEQRIRGLLAAALSAQLHRTSTTHLHAPPISKPSKGSASAASGTGKPLWSHRITNDVNSVMDLLNKSSGEAEREFRINRMSRLAREQEEDRMERQERARLGLDGGGQTQDASGAGGAPAASGDGPAGPASDDASSSAGPSTPKPDRPSFAPRSSTAPDGTPIFGAVKEREKSTPGASTPTSSSKKRKKDAFNSADVAIRSTNATALALSGMKKKYAWMGSQVHVSSPLAGKKAKKAGKDMLGEGDVAEAGAADADGDVEMSGGSGAGAAPGTPVPSKTSKKSRLRESMIAGEASTDTPLRPSSKNAGRSKVKLSAPSRRTVIVDRGGSSTGGGGPGQRPPGGPPGRPGTPQNEGGERRVRDDEALTMVDVVFALEKDALGMGMGTAAEIVKRVWNRPGGPYGRDAIAGDQPRRP